MRGLGRFQGPLMEVILRKAIGEPGQGRLPLATISARVALGREWPLGKRMKFSILGLLVFALAGGLARAHAPLHREVLVFVPAYEGSQLFDPDLGDDPHDPVCVWGCFNVFLSSKRYFALRMPNPLVARPMMAVGPVDVYRKFVETMTETRDGEPHFSPYTLGSDFFIFTYDWRQEIGSVSAPQLGAALETYARIHESTTGIPAQEARFIIVTHSMGGLVARTLLAEKPAWAPRVSRLYLVGCPNAGSVKATRTVIVGPDTLAEDAQGFPGGLLNLLPTDVDQSVTKLVGITRPSLYELLPTGDPHWTEALPDGSRRQMRAGDVFRAESWEPYWPSAALEKKLFIDGWLVKREAEGRKKIDPTEWEYCQDAGDGKLKTILAQVREWRHVLGRLSDTESMLSAPGEHSRLRVILSTGVKTPTGVVSTGAHDGAWADYFYNPANVGDGTVEGARVLDDIADSSPLVEHLHGVPHGRLMIDAQFLSYFTRELANQPTIPASGR